MRSKCSLMQVILRFYNQNLSLVHSMNFTNTFFFYSPYPDPSSALNIVLSQENSPKTVQKDHEQLFQVKLEEEQPLKEQEYPKLYISYCNNAPNDPPLRTTETKLVSKELKQPKSRKKEVDSFTARRNIIPNNVNHILSYIQRKNKSEVVVLRIMEKLGKNQLFSSKRFYSYQIYLKDKLLIHVNQETLKKIMTHLDHHQDIYSVEEQLFYNSVTRTLICYYLQQIAKPKILSSKRVKNTNKMDHLRAHRRLLSHLTGRDEEPTS